MDYFDIHTHFIPPHPTQAIVSVDASSLPMDKKIVHASVGIHPWYLTEENVDSQWKALQISVKNPRIVAIGEVGLDKRRGASIGLQYTLFRQSIALSEAYGLPMIIHCVRAFNEIIAIKKECAPRQPWIIHGFRGKASIAQELLKHGCRLSFGEKFQENTLLTVPLDRLFIETDESRESLEHIYQRIAETKGISLKELTECIKKNVDDVFFKT